MGHEPDSTPAGRGDPGAAAPGHSCPRPWAQAAPCSGTGTRPVWPGVLPWSISRTCLRTARYQRSLGSLWCLRDVLAG